MIQDSWIMIHDLWFMTSFTDLLLLLARLVGRAAVGGIGFEWGGWMRGWGATAAGCLAAQRVRRTRFLLLVLLWVLECCEQKRPTSIRVKQNNVGCLSLLECCNYSEYMDMHFCPLYLCSEWSWSLFLDLMYHISLNKESIQIHYTHAT